MHRPRGPNFCCGIGPCYNRSIDPLAAHRVLISRDVLAVAAWRRRLDAMLAKIEADEIETLSAEAFEQALKVVGPRAELQRGGLAAGREHKRLIAFGTLPPEEVFPGYGWRERRSAKRERDNGVLCHSALEIQSVVGCPYGCSYCPYTSFLCIRLDVETFVERVAKLAQTHAQSLYKLNNRSDTLGLEPEYGLAEALVRRFASLEQKYLMLYSKGDEVDHLLALPHAGKTIASFTLTPHPVAKLLERSAPSPSARIAAIGKLAAAGYPIRVRFSPIVPIVGWQDAYRDLIAELAQVASPEMITLWTLSMVPYSELDRIVPLAQLDAAAVAAAREGAASMVGEKGAPFPSAYRASLYRTIARQVQSLLPDTAVSLCLESAATWDGAAEALVPRQAGQFLCNCGPQATPPALLKLRKGKNEG